MIRGTKKDQRRPKYDPLYRATISRHANWPIKRRFAYRVLVRVSGDRYRRLVASDDDRLEADDESFMCIRLPW